MNATLKKPVVIVVSSHVARGGVGNRAAVFAFERLGFRAIAVPTVLLSWHPGLGPATRIVPPIESFDAMIRDLIGAPWLKTVGGILSGYFGEKDQAEPVAALVEAVKASNPNAVYLCDPVLGDAQGPYVSGGTVRVIRERLLPLANIATPNRYELGQLAGGDITENDRLIQAARTMGPQEIVVTSAFAKSGRAKNLLVTPDGVFSASHPAVLDAPKGTGDLLSALFLAHRLAGSGAVDALRFAVGSTLRLVEAAPGADDLPLAEQQATFFQTHEAVSLAKLD